MIRKIQGSWAISHLGDEDARLTGHTAKSEAVATTRPRVQGALAGATWVKRHGCVFNG